MVSWPAIVQQYFYVLTSVNREATDIDEHDRLAAEEKARK